LILGAPGNDERKHHGGETNDPAGNPYHF
jgi:hypothetical protein